MSDEDATNWHKVLLTASGAVGTAGLGLLTAATATATEAAFPIKMVAGGIVLTLVSFFGFYLTRPSQTSAKVERISDAIPGNPKPPMFPPPDPTPPPS